MLFILALAVGVVIGAVAHQAAVRNALGALARLASAVAGFIVGFAGTYILVAHL